MPSLAMFNNWCGALQVSKAYATKQLIFIYFIIYFPLIQEIPTEITILICGESCWQKNQTISNPLSKQRSGEGGLRKQLGGRLWPLFFPRLSWQGTSSRGCLGFIELTQVTYWLDIFLARFGDEESRGSCYISLKFLKTGHSHRHCCEFSDMWAHTCLQLINILRRFVKSEAIPKTLLH